MTLLIVGATESALHEIRALVPAGMRVVTSETGADWILVATAAQRGEAIEVHRLSPYRVVEIPELTSDLKEPAIRDAIRAGLVAIAGIGSARETPSRLGVAVARMFVRRLIGPDRPQAAPVAASLPPDAMPIGVGVAGVAGRIPAGPRLDEILATLALERVKRFVSHAVRLD